MCLLNGDLKNLNMRERDLADVDSPGRRNVSQLWARDCESSSVCFSYQQVSSPPRLPQPWLTWEVGSALSGSWKVRRSRQGEDARGGGAAGVARNLAREKGEE